MVEAARLCALAKPGQILATHVVPRVVGAGTVHNFAGFGTHALKGLPVDVDVDEVMWTPPEAAAPRVLLADDAVVVRHGIARVLEDAGFQVVGQVGDPDQLLELTSELLPDVVVTDIRMPPSFQLEGLEAALAIRRRFPEIGVLVLSQHLETEYATELLAENAAGVGYLLKERIAAIDVFTNAVRRVGAGGTAIDPDIVAALIKREGEGTPIGSLSERERDILSLMAQGLSDVAVAERLTLDLTAVEADVSRILAKLELTSELAEDRAHLVVRYLGTPR